MNYGEELAYWYLRLNGFFPVTNFVIHKSEEMDYPSDIDLIAVRPPHVFEEIGGKDEDWDVYIKEHCDFTQYVGLLCEVKTGMFNAKKVFQDKHLKVGVHRLGLILPDEVENVVAVLSTQSGFPERPTRKMICKLLISPKETPSTKYLNRSIAQIEYFILNRVQKYAGEKYASRMFFHSTMFQLLIAQIHRQTAQR